MLGFIVHLIFLLNACKIVSPLIWYYVNVGHDLLLDNLGTSCLKGKDCREGK